LPRPQTTTVKAYEKVVTLDFSRLGKPTDNALVKLFQGRLRVNCLNAN